MGHLGFDFKNLKHCVNFLSYLDIKHLISLFFSLCKQITKLLQIEIIGAKVWWINIFKLVEMKQHDMTFGKIKLLFSTANF